MSLTAWERKGAFKLFRQPCYVPSRPDSLSCTEFTSLLPVSHQLHVAVRSAVGSLLVVTNARSMVFRLNQAQLLILGLAPLTPLGRYIDTLLLLAVALRLVLVHRGGLVLRRRIDGVQDQGRGPCVDELVLRACRHNNEIAGFHILILAVDGRLALAGRESQDLVDGVFLPHATKKAG